MKTSLIIPACIIIPVLACKKDKTPEEEREVIKGNIKQVVETVDFNGEVLYDQIPANSPIKAKG